MAKNKLARFAELGTFNNVIQPGSGIGFGKDHPIKGKWREEIFRNQNPVILELGCGKGEYSIGLSSSFPHNNYIGIDIKGARMWRGAKTAHEKKCLNVAFLRTRIEFINSFFSENEVDEIWITFPDPHTGKNNANKRLTCPWFLNTFRIFLKDNGIIHLKTDNKELFDYTKKLVISNQLEMLAATNDLYSEKSLNETLSIRTYYETIFLREGMKINYLSFRLNKEKYIMNGPEKEKENNDFFTRVYDVTKSIPYGRVTSYGAIARFLGSGRSARMVGWALNICHNNPEFIPAHRVVNRNGLLTGKFHFGNSSTMRQLLENEGLIIDNDQVINFTEQFWDPSVELV